LGEFLSELAGYGRQEFDNALSRLYDRFDRKKIRTFGFGDRDTKAFAIEEGLRRSDYPIEVTDSVIVAGAFVDPSCNVYYAFDARNPMSPDMRPDRVFDSFAWVEYFRGTEAVRVVAEELDTVLVGTPLVVLTEFRDKYVREGIPEGPRDLSFI